MIKYLNCLSVFYFVPSTLLSDCSCSNIKKVSYVSVRQDSEQVLKWVGLFIKPFCHTHTHTKSLLPLAHTHNPHFVCFLKVEAKEFHVALCFLQRKPCPWRRGPASSCGEITVASCLLRRVGTRSVHLSQSHAPALSRTRPSEPEQEELRDLLCLSSHGHSSRFLHVQLRVGVTQSPWVVHILMRGQQRTKTQSLNSTPPKPDSFPLY